MDRASFGSWGTDLSDDEFAKALATIGVHNAYIGVWPAMGSASEVAERISNRIDDLADPVRCRYFGTPPNEWRRFTRVPSPNELAAAWAKIQPALARPQFEIDLSESIRKERDCKGAGWLCDQLRRAVLDARSVYLAEQPLVGHPDWQWPVRVALMNEGASRAYLAAAQAHRTVQNLTQSVNPYDRGTIDLLWISGEINDAVRLIEEAPYPIHAHAVAVFGTGREMEWATTERAKTRITELTQAQSVLFVNPENAAEWLNNLIRDLSHDVPFDVAVNWSGGDVMPVCSGPLLWSARPLIKASRISNFTRNLVRRSLKELDLDRPLVIDPSVAFPLGLPPGPNPTGIVLDRLGERMKDIGFLHESDGASVASAVNQSLKYFGVKRKPTKRSPTGFFEPEVATVPRHLQVGVFLNRWSEPLEAFARGEKHELEVHIGPPLEGRLSLQDRFPEEKLPPPSESGGHLLTVVFFEPQSMEQPELKTLFLPRVGASLPCRFEFVVGENVTEVEGRVTVLHENRVLQTGLVRGPVRTLDYHEHPDRAPWRSGEDEFGEDDGPDDGGPVSEERTRHAQIEFVLAGAVRRAIADLDLRSRFDAALVLNHASERPGLQGTAGNRSGYVWLDDNTVQEAKADIEKALDTGDWDYAEYNGLHAEGTTKLLRILALKGNRLYSFVAKNLPPAVTSARRLQVVVAKDHARFPVEFFYDFNPPTVDAPVCPHAEEALRNGTCSKDCLAAKQMPAPVVCPLGFWGLSRVLEWHAFTEQQALELPANVSGKLDIDSAPRSDEVPLGGPCLFGYSKKIDKADKDCIENFKTRVKTLQQPPVAVESWSDWKAAVKKLDPSILMLLVHTKTDEYGTSLEMGPPSASAAVAESLLLTDHLTDDYVMGPKITGSPIVLLLGCTTARAKLPFDTVATAFEYRARAGIVVATSNLIYGPKAVEVAEAFLRRILEVQDGQTFGDVTLAVRRSLLAEGLAMILCITVYGDADWKLVKH